MSDLNIIDIENKNIEDLIIDDTETNVTDVTNVTNVDYEVFYSYPYCSDDVHEYQYRITINQNEFILDEVKCDDGTEDLEGCVIFVANILKLPLQDTLHVIKKNIDIRNNQPFPSSININLNQLPLDIDESDIEEAKTYCFRELIVEILEDIDNIHFIDGAEVIPKS